MKVFFNLYSITSHFISEKMNVSKTIALFSFKSIFFCLVCIKKEIKQKFRMSYIFKKLLDTE